MPQLRGFGASIVVDGVRLDEYRVERSSSNVTAFIVGDPNKVFTVECTATSNATGWCTFIELDGQKLPGQYFKGASTSTLASAPNQGVSKYVFREPGHPFQPGSIVVSFVRVNVPEAVVSTHKRKDRREVPTLDWARASPVDTSESDPSRILSYVRMRFFYIPLERLNTLLQQVAPRIDMEFNAHPPLGPGSSSTHQVPATRGRSDNGHGVLASTVAGEQGGGTTRPRKKRRSSPKENTSVTTPATSNYVHQGPAIAGPSSQIRSNRDFSPTRPVTHGLADLSITNTPHPAMDVVLPNSSPPSIEATTGPSTPAPEEPLQGLSTPHLQPPHKLEEQDLDLGRAASLPPSLGHSRPGNADLRQKRVVSSIVPRVEGNSFPPMGLQTNAGAQAYDHGQLPNGQGVLDNQFGGDYLVSTASDYVHDVSSYLPSNGNLMLDQYNPYSFSLTDDYLTDLSAPYQQELFDMDTSGPTASY